MSIQTLEAEAKNILGTVPGPAVYDYEPKSFSSMPALTMNYIRFEQRRDRFRKHEITYFWELRLYVSLGSDSKAAMDKAKDLVNQYIEVFRGYPDLNGKAQRAEISGGTLEVVTDTQNPYYLHLFQLEIIEEEK